MSLTLDLFAEPILDEKPIAFYEKLNSQLEAANKSITQKLGLDPFVESEKLQEATERSRALRGNLVFPVERPHICPNCDGKGVLADFGVETCEVCRGAKVLTDAEMGAFSLCVNVERAADSFALARLEDQWPHAYAFVAQARCCGFTDPALTPVQVSPAGRREFDMAELARYANELLRGVRSIKPEMTPERWGGAIEKARELGGKS